MAWTSPMTWVDGEILTSSQLNLHLRDNLLETMPAKTTASSSFLVADANNNLVERTPGSEVISTDETCTSNEWGDLDTAGPTITRTVGPRVLVIWSSHIILGVDGADASATAGSVGLISVSIAPFVEPGSEEADDEGGDGGETFEPSDSYAIMKQNSSGNSADIFQGSHHMLIHDLTEEPGLYTFSLKYRKSGSLDVRFRRREIIVFPLS